LSAHSHSSCPGFGEFFVAEIRIPARKAFINADSSALEFNLSACEKKLAAITTLVTDVS